MTSHVRFQRGNQLQKKECTRQCFSRALIYARWWGKFFFFIPLLIFWNLLYYEISKSHHRGLGQSLSDSDRWRWRDGTMTLWCDHDGATVRWWCCEDAIVRCHDGDVAITRRWWGNDNESMLYPAIVIAAARYWLFCTYAVIKKMVSDVNIHYAQ